MTSASLKLALGLCLVFAFSMKAQQKDEQALSKRERRQKLYPELMRTFDLAEGAPAPLRALALLRIASFPTNKDEEWKRELLEEGFEAASQSPLRWPVAYVSPPEGPIQGALPERMIKAMEINNSGLDRLSLQTGIVRVMLPVDKVEARKLFSRISPLGLSPLTCSDGLVPNVAAYYQTASQLAKDAFTLAERKKREHLEFLRALLESMTSSTEVGPAAQVLLDQQLSSNEAGVLAATFGRQIAGLPADSRSLFDHLDSTSEAVLKFADSLASGDAVALLQAWRTYLIANLTGVRCQETVDPKWAYAKWVTGSVNAFNLRAARQESVVRIEEADIRPSKVEPALPEEHAIVSERDQEFHDKWWWLMFGGQRVGLTDVQKDTAEWRSRFEEYISSIENLGPSGDDSEVDLLKKKCDLMRDAVLAAPKGPERDYVLARYAALLKISNIQPEFVPEWFTAVNSVIGLMQSIYKDRQSVLKSLEATGDPFLSLVVALDKLETPEQKHVPSSAN